MQLAYRIVAGRWQHRIVAGYRARNRRTESGGSDARDFGIGAFGEPDPERKGTFHFSPVNAGKVKQSALMLGYVGKLADVGSINLGIQKARYRGTSREGSTRLTTTSRDNPWLYNATLMVDLSPVVSVYAGAEKGLEDSGAAPENAANANEQLPATRTQQYEGGLRWRFRGGQFVVNAFQITKPYFSFVGGNVFGELGKVRHRGVETSLSGHFGERLSLVAGAVLMQPRVTGGGRPVGTPSLYSRVDLNYRTDIFGGLTPTATFLYTGKRAYTSARPGIPQRMVAGYVALDLGVRQRFHVGKVPASFRMVVQDVFDAASWKVVAANTLYPDDRRRLTFSLAADF